MNSAGCASRGSSVGVVQSAHHPQSGAHDRTNSARPLSLAAIEKQRMAGMRSCVEQIHETDWQPTAIGSDVQGPKKLASVHNNTPTAASEFRLTSDAARSELRPAMMWRSREHRLSTKCAPRRRRSTIARSPGLRTGNDGRCARRHGANWQPTIDRANEVDISSA